MSVLIACAGYTHVRFLHFPFIVFSRGVFLMRRFFEAYMDSEALAKAEEHLSNLASEKREGLGLLLGNRYLWKGKEFVAIDDFITAENDSSAVLVNFSRSAFPELISNFKKHLGKKIIAGWMHSHLGYGCFLSSTDLRTHNNYFDQPFNVAVVMDMFLKENGKNMLRFFRTMQNAYYEIPFAVVENLSEWERAKIDEKNG